MNVRGVYPSARASSPPPAMRMRGLALPVPNTLPVRRQNPLHHASVVSACPLPPHVGHVSITFRS